MISWHIQRSHDGTYFSHSLANIVIYRLSFIPQYCQMHLHSHMKNYP